ncbi:MBL fold metallo-hydrolase [Thermus tengchongensis]|uniref:MBL fold metallo-hydrolase n=2 Tax=Thermus tengchongensis TaxID=1214928 RepID=A0A4Y9FBC4_9DEIN|nr:MBL fold metallo-hydrolase [Thermus tengchongensis]
MKQRACHASGGTERSRVRHGASGKLFPMSLSFLALGGALEVGASAHLLTLDGVRFLVDVGLRPSLLGEAALPRLDLLSEPPDAVLLTHAHLDHVGALPLLRRRFPKVPLFATRPTLRLALEVLLDSARLGRALGAELYTEREAARALLEAVEVRPFEPFAVKGVRVLPLPAGHLLGAVGYLLEGKGGRALHLGDFSLTATPTTDPAHFPPEPQGVDLLVSEGTYGDTFLPSRKEQVREFLSLVGRTLREGGRVLIPTFALGRAQDLLFHLLEGMRTGLVPKVPVVLDGLVRTLTRAYEEELADFLPEALRNLRTNSRMPLFLREGVVEVKDARHRAELLLSGSPMVVLASGGMLNGGPSPLWASHFLREEGSALLLVGYQDEESPGRRLLELKRGDELLLPVGEERVLVRVDSRVERFHLSAHADRAGILNLLSRYPARLTLLVHGEPQALHTLSRALEGRASRIPRVEEAVSLEPAPAPEPEEKPPARPAAKEKAPRKVPTLATHVRVEVRGHTLLVHFPPGRNPARLLPPGTYRLRGERVGAVEIKLSPSLQGPPPPDRQALLEEALAYGEARRGKRPLKALAVWREEGPEGLDRALAGLPKAHRELLLGMREALLALLESGEGVLLLHFGRERPLVLPL